MKSAFLEPVPAVYDKCNPSPCGANAVCNDGQCTCMPNFFGNPYLSCRPECTNNADCPQSATCVNNKCINPCTNLCGQGAVCEVYNHIPMCSCPSNTSGNAFFSCTPITGKTNIKLLPKQIWILFLKMFILKVNAYFSVHEERDPCHPTPCGPYSICRAVQGQAVCSCLIGYIGVPPSCRPECLVDSDCTSVMACSNQKCTDPCQGSCGLNAECRVHNHKPICYCRNGYTGDPFTHCVVVQGLYIYYILHIH